MTEQGGASVELVLYTSDDEEDFAEIERIARSEDEEQ